MAKLDLYAIPNPKTIRIKDWKSGKKEGNEIKHTLQSQLYAIDALARYPSVEVLSTTFYYIDEGRLDTKIYKREKVESWRAKWTERANKMTNALVFPPKPSKSNCRFCDFGPNGTAVCEFGIDS